MFLMHTVYFWPKKEPIRGRLHSRSNFSALVAITFKIPQSCSGRHEFNVSLKEQTSLSTDICVGVEFLIITHKHIENTFFNFFFNQMIAVKGRSHEEKLLFFWMLSKLPPTRPPPPFSDVKSQFSLLKILYIPYIVLYIYNQKNTISFH